MPHIAEQQRGWEPEHTLSVAEAIKEAMDTTSPPRRSKSLRRGRSSAGGEALPEPHLPLRKASAHGRMQSRKGPVPKPLFAHPPPPPPKMMTMNPAQRRQQPPPNQQHHAHQLRGFNPSPVPPPVPHVDSFTASSEHAFAGREPRRAFKPALGVLEDQQQTVLQYAEMRSPAYPEYELTRPPLSPLHPSSTASPMSSPKKKGKSLRKPRSVGEGLRSLRHKVSSKHHKDINGRLTPESFTTARPSPRVEDEIRESFRSALTSHSSLAHTSTNTTYTSVSSRSESFVKVRREDWDEGGLTDVDMSVEDAIGMYENGFESAAGSAKGSLDIRSIRSTDVGKGTPGIRIPEVQSVRSLQMEGSLPQPQSLPHAPRAPLSQPSTPTKKRPNAAHRRSQSASILILGVPRAARVGASPSSGLRAPEMTANENQRTSMQIVCNEQSSRPGTGAFPVLQDGVPRDRYGFKKVSQHVTVEQYDAWNKHYSRHIERRSKKWHALMSSYGLSTSPAIRFPPKSDKIKRYVRKGIPPEFRGAAWFWYAGGPGKLAKEPGLYWELVEKAKPDEGFLSSNDREHIERDLHRTFPDNVRFKPDPSTMMDAQAGAGGGDDGSPDSIKKRRATKEPETPILKSLRRVLQAFAIHNPSIGYCQSLNFIAGLLLLFLDEDEEKAFVLLNIVTSTHLPGTHGVALEGANVDIAVLMSCIKDSLPLVWHKLDDKGGMLGGDGIGGSLRLPTVSLATTAWFMSLFVGTLPIESVLRVWDCLFFEGSKTLFRIALAIFKAGEAQITSVSDPMEIFQVVQTIPRGMLDVNGLMEVCFRRRGGFGGVSQGLVERRRAERRRVVKEGVERVVDDEEGALRRIRGKLRRQTGKV